MGYPFNILKKFLIESFNNINREKQKIYINFLIIFFHLNEKLL